jgi:hypothetical protein
MALSTGMTTDAAPTPLQTLILWALVSRGGEALQKELRPEPKKADRDALVRAGLVQSGLVKRAVRIELTDRGWAWAAANTAARLPTGSTAGTAILAALLARLGAFMAARDIALADIIQPAPLPDAATPEAKPALPAPDLAARIRAAYLAESGGAVNRRVPLSLLRAHFADVARADLDAALRALAHSGHADLLPFDDPADIRPADRDASLAVGVEPRHLLWLHG